MRVGRFLLVAAGALTLVAGLGSSGAGAGLLWANATQRDATGYFNSSSQTFESGGTALTSSVDFAMRPGPNDWLSIDPLGTVRVRADVTNGGTFVGIAATSMVQQYLAGVTYDRVTTVKVMPFRPVYQSVTGSRLPASPVAQQFWATSASGVGPQQITWRPTTGNWTLVVMRADAGAGVVAHVSVGTNTGLVGPLGVALIAGGIVLLVAGGVMLGFAIMGLDRKRRERVRADVATVSGTTSDASNEREGASSPRAYPARLDGHLDSSLSRWRWIVKPFLILPHLIVLAVLWLAVMPLTVFAGVAILVTGRYPEPIFHFTVGVMRWTWRVVFYSFSALATDQYPPFSLEADESYPASFSVDYPQRLSRGLVLVKWWLLAIPQYLIVGIFAGGGIGFAGGHSNDWTVASRGGVIGLLVVVAALVLIITGRYPRALFDFVMGMNRWCFRVLTYALLLRDEYPPFSFDAGGTDPGNAVPATPPSPPVEPAPDRSTPHVAGIQ
ncbi:MAG: DUF4389 domain-containing protein [Acidobacteria bacterium]|nr:DUF4389 domain-containing protein [Acidobacteriota bacterium]